MKKIDLKGVVEGLTDEVAEKLLQAGRPRSTVPVTKIFVTPSRTQISFNTVNVMEMASIKALISYAANENGLTEMAVRAVLVDEFGLEKLEHLPKQKYDDAVKFLVDFKGCLN